MGNTYSYGPLKSSYLSTYEKIWIEGYCKENKIILTESNLTKTLMDAISNCNTSEVLDKKVCHLMREADKFSGYAKNIFLKSWSNVFGFMLKSVKPTGVLSESQIKSMKETSDWWRHNAPMILANELGLAYYNGIVLECMSNNDKVLDELKTFNPSITNSLMETSKKLFSYEKIKLQYPSRNLNEKEILCVESGLNLLPEPKKILDMIAWAAETTKLTHEK